MIFGIILGVAMLIGGAGMMCLLEWSRQLTVTILFILGLMAIAYFLIMMNPLAQSDRFYGSGPSNTVVYTISLALIAAAYAGGRLLRKHKHWFRKGWK